MLFTIWIPQHSILSIYKTLEKKKFIIPSTGIISKISRSPSLQKLSQLCFNVKPDCRAHHSCGNANHKCNEIKFILKSRNYRNKNVLFHKTLQSALRVYNSYSYYYFFFSYTHYILIIEQPVILTLTSRYYIAHSHTHIHEKKTHFAHIPKNCTRQRRQPMPIVYTYSYVYERISNLSTYTCIFVYVCNAHRVCTRTSLIYTYISVTLSFIKLAYIL